MNLFDSYLHKVYNNSSKARNIVFFRDESQKC